MFANLKLRNRILIGYSVPIVLLLGLSGLAYSNASQVSNSIADSKRSQTVVSNIDDLVIAASKMERGTRGYLITKDDEFRKTYEEALEDFHQASENLSLVTKNPEQKARLEKLTELFKRLNQIDRNFFKLVEERKTAEAIKLFSQLQSRKILSEIEVVADEFMAKQDDVLAQITSQAQASSNLMSIASGLGALLALAVSITTAFLISLSIAQTLNRAASAMASSSTEIATTVEQQERTISQQATSVTQTTTTMDELGASSRQSAEQAEASASGARQALSLAEDGTRAVQETLEGMSTLKDKVGAIAEQILRLSEQTQQI
ncbi:MAG TPA: chemotaxis protein, partial [Cyanobacteria bacterium UBA11049]|nr:chemotaxis protein [Cyanobacteria bacterium UBA11049]